MMPNGARVVTVEIGERITRSSPERRHVARIRLFTRSVGLVCQANWWNVTGCKSRQVDRLKSISAA